MLLISREDNSNIIMNTSILNVNCALTVVTTVEPYWIAMV